MANDTTKLSKKELEAKVKNLESEINDLKKSKGSKSGIKDFIRSLTIWVLAIICAFFLNFAVAAGWLKRNIVNTDVWTSKTVEIMQNEDVKNQLSSQITDQIFEATDAEQAIEEFVPPKASALAVPLTQSLKSYTNEKVYGVLSSDQFQEYWRDLNYSAHEGIISSLENGGQKPETGNYVMYIDDEKLLLNLNPIFKKVQSDLSNAGLNFVDKINSDRVNKTITLTEIQNLPAVLYAFNVLNKGVYIILIISFVSGAGAIALARNKRRLVIIISTVTAILMIINVQTIYFARAPLVKQVGESLQSSSSAAATAIFDILTKDLITYNRLLVVISILILLTAILSGPGKFSVYVRTKIKKLTYKDNKFINHLSENAVAYVSILAFIFAIFILLGLAKNIALLVIVLIIFCLTSIWLLSIKK